MRKTLIAFTTALTAGATFLAACGGGSDADLPALATEAAAVEPQRELTVVADDLEFDTNIMVMPAAQEVSIVLDNQDGGTLHNIAVYTEDSGDRQEIFRGDLFQGGESRTYTFTSPAAGVYFFRCDAHPDMNGAFITK